MSARVFLGNLASRTTEKDIEEFFRKAGHLKQVMLKSGFGFAEFEDPRDADDAIKDYHRRDLCGSLVTVERAKPRLDSFSGGRGSRDRTDRGRDRYDRGDRRDSYRDGPRPAFRPLKTRYRLTVENLSSRCSWQDLKSLMKQAGWITFADAHRDEKNVGVVYFERHEELKRAIEKFQGEEINGRRIKLIDDTRSPSRSRSRSLSRSPRRKRQASRSISPRRHSRSRSRSPRRKRQASRSNSPRRLSRSRSRSRSNSPIKKDHKNSRSLSRSPVKKDISRSKSPIKNGRKHSRSVSRSPVKHERKHYSPISLAKSPLKRDASRSPNWV